MSLLIIKYRLLAIVLVIITGVPEVVAQDVDIPKAQRHRHNMGDSVTIDQIELDSLQLQMLSQVRDSIARLDSLLLDSIAPVGHLDADSIYEVQYPAKKFIPDSKKALWLAIAFPGGGQIYNRKYWKLPLVYGGFLGCFYALSWNNNMYRDYSQAYIDIADSNPDTKSYMNFIPPTYDVDSNIERLKTIFQNKKNYYRRFRDLSFFSLLAVYGLSIIDAYVDAELSSFDIGPDLSLKVKPSIINDGNNPLARHGIAGNSYGLQCSIDF